MRRMGKLDKISKVRKCLLVLFSRLNSEGCQGVTSLGAQSTTALWGADVTPLMGALTPFALWGAQ